jgi:hypothetical protein
MPSRKEIYQFLAELNTEDPYLSLSDKEQRTTELNNPCYFYFHLLMKFGETCKVVPCGYATWEDIKIGKELRYERAMARLNYLKVEFGPGYLYDIIFTEIDGVLYDRYGVAQLAGKDLSKLEWNDVIGTTTYFHRRLISDEVKIIDNNYRKRQKND